MADSVVAICNLALDLLGEQPIASLDDPGKNAGLCKRNYELARDASLRSYPWNCAKARTQIAAQYLGPEWGVEHAYPLPVDCLRVLGVQDEVPNDIRWRVEGRRILSTAAAPLNVLYVAKVTDPSAFDALLVQAIAARLAAILCFPVTGKDTMSERLTGLAASFERQAARIDAREQSQDDALVADLWTGARYSLSSDAARMFSGPPTVPTTGPFILGLSVLS